MKKVYVFCALVIIGMFLLSSNLYADMSPVGVWKTIADEGKNKGKESSYVEIYEKNGKYYAKIVKLLLDPPDTVCDKCSGSRKDKPLIGMGIMWNLKREKGSDVYSGGKILDPENGKIYKCYIEVQKKGKKLKVRGYIGFSLLGRSQYWFRVK